MSTAERFAAVILLAAGGSKRMRAGLPEESESKVFLPLAGRCSLERCLTTFAAAACIGEIVVVAREADHSRVRRIARAAGIEIGLVTGGQERTDSVRAGFGALRSPAEVVLVHDVVRPLVRVERVEAVAAEAREHGAALLASPVTDTIKRAPDGLWARETLERAELWAARTPQAFQRGRLGGALERALADGFRPTDDAALHERYFGPVRVVEDDAANAKLTSPADRALLEAWLAASEGRPMCAEEGP